MGELQPWYFWICSIPDKGWSPIAYNHPATGSATTLRWPPSACLTFPPLLSSVSEVTYMPFGRYVRGKTCVIYLSRCCDKTPRPEAT